MRLFFLGNGALACRVLGWLHARGEKIVGLALHPPERRRNADDLDRLADQMKATVFAGDQLSEMSAQARIADLYPDIGLSVMFGYILRADFLSLFPRGCVNVHTGLLPFNRGAHPNVWSIIDRTPAGVTLHFVDAGVDTGPVIAQRQVDVEPVDTGMTLYAKLEDAAFDLLTDTWPALAAGKLEASRQREDVGTCHRVRDLATTDRIELERSYSGRQLIDLLRARTFPPYAGAHFVEGGRKIHVRIELEYGEEVPE